MNFTNVLPPSMQKEPKDFHETQNFSCLLDRHYQLAECPSPLRQTLYPDRCVTEWPTGHVTLHEGRHDHVAAFHDQKLITCFRPQARLILISEGGLSRFMRQMALGMGFEVIVCPPREEHRRQWALDGVTLSLEMPDDLMLRLRPDARTAVVALTHYPKLGGLVLIYALQSQAFYVGAIVSLRHSALRKDCLHTHLEVPLDELNALHGPAGLYIGSKTPAEIALAIMAEIVAAKNGVRSDKLKPVVVGKAALEAPDGVAWTAQTCAV